MEPLKLEAAAPVLSLNQLQIETIGPVVVQEQMAEIGIGSIGQPHITQLAARHEADFRDMLLNLDQPSRSIRFDGVVSDDCLVRHSRCAFSSAAWIAGAFVDETLRGVVEVYDIGDSRTVEAAFLVERTWRRRGLGSALLRAALQWAAETDRIMLRMVFSRHNWPMRKLASNAEARLDLGFGEITADVAIGAFRVLS
jgi:GNAT superfamily N-acetyltransferase